MRRGHWYQGAVISTRLMLSAGLTILLCYYLPTSLNRRQPQPFQSNEAVHVELLLPEVEKQKTPMAKEAEAKPLSANISAPVAMSLPLVSAVADMALQVPALAVPSLNGMSLPDIGPVIAGIADVYQPPELLRFIQPKMPVAGRKFKSGGKVLLRLIVEADGMVSQARVLEAKPEKIFDMSAIKAARKWRFKPAILSGVAVKVFVDVPIHFKVN